MAVTAGEFQVFVKPVGAKCNLSCRYCYYLGKEQVCGPDSTFLMSEEILERYISSHIKNSGEETAFFSWHGGEPTLAGIGFFEKALEIQKRHCPPALKIINGMPPSSMINGAAFLPVRTSSSG
jgi:uncharacterized protein